MSTEETTKDYSGFLIVNWRDDNVRYRKTPPNTNKQSPYEIAIPVSVSVAVPSVTVPEIEADIEVPPAEVEHAVSQHLPEGEDE